MIGDSRPGPSAAALTGGALLCVLGSCGAGAADWFIQPRVSVGETWSDNINLSGVNQEHDFVTEISPGVSISGRGARLTLDFDYQLTLVNYARDTSGHRFDNRLQATGSAELLQQRLFVDFTGTAGQINQSSRGTVSDDIVSVNSNRSNFWTAQVSPYLVHHFGPYADGTLRYTHAHVENSGSVSTTNDALEFFLVSGRSFPWLPWTLDVSWSRDDNSNGTSNEFRLIDGSVRYTFNRRYALRFNLGYQDNNLVSLRGDTSGLSWRATAIWTPSPRTDVEIGYGNDFFGHSLSLDATHTARRAVMSFSYSEEVTTSAANQLGSGIFPTEDAFGDPIVDPGLPPERIDTNVFTISDQAVLSRVFSGQLSVRGKRSTFSVSGFHDHRSFSVSGGDEMTFGISTNVNHPLNRLTSANLGGSWQRSDFDDTGREDTRWQVNLSLSRRFNRDISGTLSYSHLDNDSDLASDSYEENRVDARLSVVF